MDSPAEDIASRLNAVLAEAGQDSLSPEAAGQFARYCSLLLRWNARTNLTAVRDLDSILTRHMVECIACARLLPAGIGTLLDFGSGAGLPGIPVAICRPEIAVTLAESQGKKAAFLREAMRTIPLAAQVYSGRAEAQATRFDCVTLRAVDKMVAAIDAASGLVAPGGWLALMMTETQWDQGTTPGPVWMEWAEPLLLPNGGGKILALGRSTRAR